MRGALTDALDRARNYVLSSQRPDGTWSGPVDSDVRPTAFYLYTILNLGRAADDCTREMERYLLAEQLECGAWQAWPGSGPDLDVTTMCVLALDKAGSEHGRRARLSGQRWLTCQPLPEVDSFWKGVLALRGDLAWSDLPYLTPRLVTNPGWLHPNIYDFSFLRIAVVCACLLQAGAPQRSANGDNVSDAESGFIEWKRRWVAQARKPQRGILPTLCGIMHAMDQVLSVSRHKVAALEWLLMHQEDDGSFFSSVHMTSIAVLTLHTIDRTRFEKEIEAGVNAMRNWQTTDQRGCRQQFTDSTNWDTILFFDLLRQLGVPSSARQMQRARKHVVSCQNQRLGDWSRRVRNPSPGGWAFQRVGHWYPDNDDTVMALSALLEIDAKTSSEVTISAVRWLLSMQSSNGGWASWDRNDRSWIQIPNGGPWFARDLACAEITARIVILLSRIVRGDYSGFDTLVPQAREALARGAAWLKRQRRGAAWYGRWFTHYLYGTCHVLEAYRELGYPDEAREVREALDWVLSVANSDGGFGEAPVSGRDNSFIPAPSTPFHTACGLMALIYAGASHLAAAEDAATWLLKNQDVDGGWSNKDFFAAGVPGLWYANFALTPTYFVTKSLLLFRRHRWAAT